MIVYFCDVFEIGLVVVCLVCVCHLLFAFDVVILCVQCVCCLLDLPSGELLACLVLFSFCCGCIFAFVFCRVELSCNFAVVESWKLKIMRARIRRSIHRSTRMRISLRRSSKERWA